MSSWQYSVASYYVKRSGISGVPVQPSRKGGRRFAVSLLLLDAVCYDEQLLLRGTHPQRAPCREKDENVLSLYLAIYRPYIQLYIAYPYIQLYIDPISSYIQLTLYLAIYRPNIQLDIAPTYSQIQPTLYIARYRVYIQLDIIPIFWHLLGHSRL